MRSTICPHEQDIADAPSPPEYEYEERISGTSCSPRFFIEPYNWIRDFLCQWYQFALSWQFPDMKHEERTRGCPWRKRGKSWSRQFISFCTSV